MEEAAPTRVEPSIEEKTKAIELIKMYLKKCSDRRITKMQKRQELAKQRLLQSMVEEEIEHRSVASRFSSPLYPLDLDAASQRTVKTQQFLISKKVKDRLDQITVVIEIHTKNKDLQSND